MKQEFLLEQEVLWTLLDESDTLFWIDAATDIPNHLSLVPARHDVVGRVDDAIPIEGEFPLINPTQAV